VVGRLRSWGLLIDHVRDARFEVIDAAWPAKSSADSRDKEIPATVDAALSQLNGQPATEPELTVRATFYLDGLLSRVISDYHLQSLYVASEAGASVRPPAGLAGLRGRNEESTESHIDITVRKHYVKGPLHGYE
jgi:hypothetical protein